MTPKLKKIILILVAIGVLFVIYAVFIKKDPESTSLIAGAVNNTQTSADAQLLGNQISQALLRIEQIKLNKAIFSNEIYRSLVDRSQPIAEEAIGRSNPFAPLGDISISSVVKTNATSTRSATSTGSATSSPSGSSN